MRDKDYLAILQKGSEILGEAIHVVDAKGITIIYNEAMAKLEKIGVEDALGKPFREVFSYIPHHESTLAKALTEGEDHPYLYLVQVMLQALSAAYRSIPAPAATGVLDSQTARALADFQYLSGLPQTGELDKITWKNLALQYPLAVNITKSQNRRNF